MGTEIRGIFNFVAAGRQANFTKSPAAGLYLLMNQAKITLETEPTPRDWAILLNLFGVDLDDVLESAKTLRVDRQMPAYDSYKEFIAWLDN